MKNLFETYLKGVNKYNLKMFIETDNILISKKIIDIDEPFYLIENDKKICVLQNGFSIVEYMPIPGNYVCRIHIDNEKKVIEYFFITSLDNRLENNIPLFRDLKLSVVYCDGICKLYNQEAIKQLLDDNKITLDEYNKSYEIANNIMNEIKNNNNEIVNNVTELIRRSDV